MKSLLWPGAPDEEAITTGCRSVINATEVAQWASHSFSRPQPDTDNAAASMSLNPIDPEHCDSDTLYQLVT